MPDLTENNTKTRANMFNKIARERSALLKVEEALRPFAEAWAIANRHKTPMTLAEFGALAMHHCSSVDFRKAHVALSLLDEARGGANG